MVVVGVRKGCIHACRAGQEPENVIVLDDVIVGLVSGLMCQVHANAGALEQEYAAASRIPSGCRAYQINDRFNRLKQYK